MLIIGATNRWCTAKPTITAESTTIKVTPFSFVNSFIFKNLFMNNLDTKFKDIEIRFFFVNLNTCCCIVLNTNDSKGFRCSNMFK